MPLKYFLELTLLAAIWGGSFFFTRLSVHEFGAVPLTSMRAAVAALTLMPVLLISGHWPAFRAHWRHILVVGLASTALPFSLISITTQFTSAGFSSIINSMTPIFSALIGWLWLREKLSPAAAAGTLLGFAGVLVMITDTRTISADFVMLPILTGLAATTLYGFTGNYSRRFLEGIPPIAIAAGCQFFAAVALLPVAWLLWPDEPISARGWFSAVILGVVCTGLAFLLFFQLLARVGVARTVIVTYLVPVFAMLWGWLFLAETVTGKMLAGAACILTGIALATGILRRRKNPFQ